MKTFPLYRIGLIVGLAVKFFAQIVWFQRRHRNGWTPEVQARWEELLRRQAAEYKRKALKLEGLLIKVGQFLSARADVLPRVFIDELADLVDRVPAVPWEAARQVMESEWRVPYGQVLHKISAAPVASASIGEVYHGYLHNGDSVAVKIQRPGIEGIIRADFRALRIVLWMAEKWTPWGKKADLPALYRELVAVISDELNFRQEMANGLYFRERYKDEEGVYIPRYYDEHSTRRVLVMEWIEGAKVSDETFLAAQGIDRRALATRLFRCFASQLFFEGKFHADPHPGNLLVRPDGTLVLIDFGMVGTIRNGDAQHIRSLVEGIVLQDFAKVIEALEQLRFLLPHADKPELERVLQLMVKLYAEHDMTKVEYDLVQHIIEDIERVVREQPIQMPSEFAFLGRAVSIFVGVLAQIDPTFDLKEEGKPLIKEWLNRQGGGDGQAAGGRFGRLAGLAGLARNYLKPLLKLPRLIEQAAERPERQLHWERRKQQNELLSRYHESVRRMAWLALLVSLGVCAAAAWWEREAILYASGGAAFVSLLVLRSAMKRHLRFLQTLGKE